MKLYEIDQSILNLIDPETGEIDDYEAFEQLQMERDAKIENVALWAKNLASEARAIREEEKALAERRKAAESKCERLTAYLEYALGGSKFSTPKVAISYRKSTGVVIDGDENDWMTAHPHYIRVKVEQSLNRTELMADLKAGKEIPGARLEERQNLQIK